MFSVVIPTFNRIELLKRALESVFSQWFKEFEIIVVDDGSADRTIEYLRSLGQRVRIIRQNNRGPGSARNLGVRHAKALYLAFLDSDDLWFPWTLEVYQKVIQECGEPSFITGKPYVFSGDHELWRTTQGVTQIEKFSDYLASGDQWRWWGASSFVIRRNAFEAAGGFTEEWVNGEDADLALRLGVAPGFIQITEPVTFAYREHVANARKDVRRTFEGVRSIVEAEQAGRYPGGRARSAERRRILTRHTRPVTLGCLGRGLRREAWHLYIATLVWNILLGRVTYLAAFPAVAVVKAFNRAKVVLAI
jgi:glycosyl transferase family 2